LIVCALAIVLSTGISQRRELRRLRPEASRRRGDPGGSPRPMPWTA